jgi:hypothetical protein
MFFELVFLVVIGTMSDGYKVEVADQIPTLQICEQMKKSIIIRGTNGVAKGDVKPGFRVECQKVRFEVQPR